MYAITLAALPHLLQDSMSILVEADVSKPKALSEPDVSFVLKIGHCHFKGYGDTFFIEEVFVKISGKQHYLCWAVD